MCKVKAVIFDMDGVLFDTERLIVDCWRKVSKECDLSDMESVITECVGLNDQDTDLVFKQRFGQEFDYSFFKKRVHELFYHMLETDGLPVKHGVYEILPFLKEHGYRIGLASSSNKRSVEHHLEEASISQYFEAIIGGDMVVHSKPDPQIYQMACKRVGIDPKEAIALEDSLNGLRSAYRAGMMPIMVPDLILPNAEAKEITTRICKDLVEVMDWLNQIREKA